MNQTGGLGMIDKRRATTAAVTLAVAFGTGYIMQYGGAVAERVSDTPKPITQETPQLEGALSTLPPMPMDLQVSGFGRKSTTIHARRLAAIDAGFSAPSLTDAQTPTPFQLACEVTLAATTATAAMIDLQMNAPCDSNVRITVQHAALSFTDVTDGNGNYQISIPAMVATGDVTISFDDGRMAAADVHVPQLEEFSRSAIVWDGGPGLYIHAFEFGAGYGQAGNVWAGAPRGPDAAMNGKGGFLTRLGNEAALHPTLAEVYSLPVSRLGRQGAVRMMVEAELSERSCGRTLTGKTIELGNDGATRHVALELPMPDCDAGGGYLVLKNLLRDMKIASN